MNWINETLREFGRRMGIPGLAPNHNGVLSLAVEKAGTLFIEAADEESVLVYMAREIPRFEQGIYARALRLCHYDQGLPFPVNAGYRDEDILVFIVRITRPDFTLPTLENIVAILIRLHEQVLKKE